MKIIWKRNYNIKKRLYIEGLYLNEAGFNVGESISYTLNKQNKSAMIRLCKSKYSNKVTHNISRSGKTVPTIGIRNKIVEDFINNNDNMELLVFNGVIVLINKNESNQNIALCQALIVHNSSLKSNIKKIFEVLINLKIVDDSIFINALESLNQDVRFTYKNIGKLPSRIINSLKRKFREQIYKNSKCKSTLASIASNSFVLCCIVKESIALDDIEDDILTSFVFENLNVLRGCFNIACSIAKQRIRLYKKNGLSSILASIERCLIEKLNYRVISINLLSYNKRLSYYKKIIETLLRLLGYIFLRIRKQINTLSPPSISNSCLKCLVW